MWWLTAACLLLAIGLVWQSMPESGLPITVRFPEGHGLQPEDQVLYRGIEVGTVDAVELGDNLSNVDVSITLRSSASNLAREGTRFWIVRPQLSLTRIAGLETAVGHKYVSLAPGPSDSQRQYQFDGLIEPPPEDASSPGIEFVIRGDKRYSVAPGSSVSFRGVNVGRILSVNLSQDSRFVDIRAKIFERHRQNLTTSSRFWSTSGINFDFSLSEGLKFDTESLASIAQGGVSFLTINSNGEPIQPGHIFRLNAKPEDDWFVAANAVSSTTVDLGGAIKIQKQWKQKGLLGKRTRFENLNAIPFRSAAGAKKILLPSDAALFTEKAIDGTQFLLAATSNGNQSMENPSDQIEPASVAELGVISWPSLEGIAWLDASDFREPEAQESVLAVRANVGDSDITFLHYPIEGSYIRSDWTLPHFDGDSELWHGSPVLSADDGKVVGILLVNRQDSRIIPFEASLLGK